MFEPLFARLADRYHLVRARLSGLLDTAIWPDPKKFAYTFDHYAEIMNHFTEGARASALHALYAGLRRSCGFFAWAGASGAR